MPAGNTISHVDEGPISPASRKYGRLTVVPSVSMFSRAWGWPSTMSCVAAGSGVARAGFVDASNDSVPVFETLSNRGVSVKSSGGSGLPAFEYEMFSVPPSARLSVTAMVRPVNPTLAFSKKVG